MTGKTIDQLSVGDSETFSKTVSESDIYQYAGITGDLNPAHIDKEYAGTTVFKDRIAHGMLLGGFISTVIGTKLPGPGAIYREQQLRFKAPVYIGDTITARVEVESLDYDKNKIVLVTTCTNQDGTRVVEGHAQIHPPRKEDIKKSKY